MSLVALLAIAIAIAIAAYLVRHFLPDNQKRRSLRSAVKAIPVGGPAQTAAAPLSKAELAEKTHTVELAVLQAELAVSSEEHALECALQVARDSLTHQGWLAGLTPHERELYSQSAADLEAAVGPAPFSLPPAGDRSKALLPEHSGDDWVDRQIEEGVRRQSDRRLQIFRSTISSLRAEPKLLPFMKDALMKLGREDLWAAIS